MSEEREHERGDGDSLSERGDDDAVECPLLSEAEEGSASSSSEARFNRKPPRVREVAAEDQDRGF